MGVLLWENFHDYSKSIYFLKQMVISIVFQSACKIVDLYISRHGWTILSLNSKLELAAAILKVDVIILLSKNDPTFLAILPWQIDYERTNFIIYLGQAVLRTYNMNQF